ncbi:MAG: hypothetical protein AAGF20_01915 [Pseudomonadota bacterium]
MSVLKSTASLVAAIGLLVSPAVAQKLGGSSANLKPGQWSATIDFDVNGQKFSESMTDCMSATEASHSYATLIEEFAGGMDCDATVTASGLISTTFTLSGCTGSIAGGTLTMTRKSDEKMTIGGDMQIKNNTGGIIQAKQTTVMSYQKAICDSPS